MEFQSWQCSVEPGGEGLLFTGAEQAGRVGRESHDAADPLTEEESSGGKTGDKQVQLRHCSSHNWRM